MTEESVRDDMTHFLDGIAAQDPDFRYQLIVPVSAQQPNMPAREATALDVPVVAELIKAHQKVTGQMPVVGAGHRIGATADTCHFKGVGIKCVEYGPGFIPTWPMVDECVEVAQIVTATRALALTAAELLHLTMVRPHGTILVNPMKRRGLPGAGICRRRAGFTAGCPTMP